MICPHCQSTDTVTIQGQLYCINCGRQIDAASVKQAPAASPEVAKLADAMQAEVTATLKEVSSIKSEPTAQKTPASEAIKPTSVTTPEPEVTNDSTPSPMIVNHKKGKESVQTAPQTPTSEVKDVVAEVIKPEPVIDQKPSAAPAKVASVANTIDKVAKSTPPTPNKRSSLKHRSQKHKKPHGNHPTMLIVPQPIKVSPYIVLIPAFASALLAAFPGALLTLWILVQSTVLEAWVRAGVIAVAVGAFAFPYRLYVIGLLAEAKDAELSGRNSTPHSWRQVSKAALARLIVTESVANLTLGLTVSVLGGLSWWMAGQPGAAPFIQVAALFIILFLGLTTMFAIHSVRMLTRYELIIDGQGITKATSNAWNLTRSNFGLIFMRWLTIVAVAAISLSPGLYLIKNPSGFSFIQEPAIAVLINTALATISGLIILVLSTRLWLATYRSVRMSGPNPNKLGPLSGTITAILSANGIIMLSGAVWAWFNQPMIVDVLLKLLKRG